MDWRKLLIGIASLALLGCAQVGQITGGEKDTSPPKPVAELSKPANGSTYFTGKQVDLVFDEFVQLNNPQQTMSIVPKHATLKTSLKKKTVTISWEEELVANTTYVISLNGTIKDVSEGNDSLIQVVFSTGATVDSLSYKGRLINSYTNKKEKDIVVGLFSLSDSIAPVYFTKSTADGTYGFAYLKDGKYNVFAFEDSNADLMRQSHERTAFRNDILVLDSNQIDTVPLRMFLPKPPPTLRNVRFQSPGSFLVGSTTSLTDAQFQLNGTAVEQRDIKYIKEDSVQLFFPVQAENSVEIIARLSNWVDTVSVRIPEKDRKGKMKVRLLGDPSGLGPDQPLAFLFTDRLAQMDTTKMKCVDPATQLRVPFTASFHDDTLFVEPNRASKKSIQWVFLPGSAIGQCGTGIDSVGYTIPLKLKREFGSVRIKATGFPDYCYFELLKDNQVVRRGKPNVQGELFFDDLLPGEYSQRVIDDANKNGKWDTGDLPLHIVPEDVRYFTNPIRIRSNWEVEVELQANP